MKIISRKELIAMPPGTIYTEFHGLSALNEWLRKGESLENDWYACDLLPYITYEWNDDRHPYNHVAFSTDETRDGCYDDSTKYLILEDIDKVQLIKTIFNCQDLEGEVVKIEEEDI